MDSNNQNNTGSAFTNVNSTAWNLEKISMETNEHDRNIVLQVQDHQIPMGSGIWPNYNPFQIPPSSNNSVSLSAHMEGEEEGEEELGAMKEMMYKIAAMQPVDIDPATIRKPKRRNVRISDDPQSVAARHRRERISEKIRILQRLVPGGTKMDTASMLDEAIRYVKFLKRQIRLLQSTPQPPQCIATAPAPPLLAPPVSCDWPFAPNILLTNSTTAASVDLPAGVGFDGAGGHGHACDASSSFNHHQVISE